VSEPDKPTVVVTHWVHPEVVDRLEAFSRPVVPNERDVMPRDDVLAALTEAEGVVACMADHVDEAFLAAAPRLRIVSATLKGYDNIDVDACTRRGIWLTVLPDELTAPSAELVLTLTLGILRRVREGDQLVRSGEHTGWRPVLYGATLAGSTVGIIGLGAVGRACARLFEAFGARVVYTDPAEPASLPLEELLRASDVVVPLVPLAAETRDLLDQKAIAAMRAGTTLVNVCRGSVVDELAVADALESDHLAGYAADVFAMEDWAVADRPSTIPQRLLEHPRTLFTPHLGTAVDSARLAMSVAAVRQVEAALSGRRPAYAVNEVDT
jgi:phosphonate dehydrogenase